MSRQLKKCPGTRKLRRCGRKLATECGGGGGPGPGECCICRTTWTCADGSSPPPFEQCPGPVPWRWWRDYDICVPAGLQECLGPKFRARWLGTSVGQTTENFPGSGDVFVQRIVSSRELTVEWACNDEQWLYSLISGHITYSYLATLNGQTQTSFEQQITDLPSLYALAYGLGDPPFDFAYPRPFMLLRYLIPFATNLGPGITAGDPQPALPFITCHFSQDMFRASCADTCAWNTFPFPNTEEHVRTWDNTQNARDCGVSILSTDKLIQPGGFLRKDSILEMGGTLTVDVLEECFPPPGPQPGGYGGPVSPVIDLGLILPPGMPKPCQGCGD